MKKLLIAILVMMVSTSVYSASRYSVHGAVKNSSGNPVPGLTVQLFQKQPKAQALLGSTQTGQNGSYEISYSPQVNLKGMTIFIHLLDNHRSRIYESPPIIHPKTSELLNITLP
jgi:5-hydroxyisourate hydrolase-like protein (transthyretin family)